MSTVNLEVAAKYPDGTTVGAYPRDGQPSGENRPIGAPVASGTVSGGSLTLSGLTEDVRYIGWGQVAGEWRQVTFLVDLIPDPIRVGGVEVASQAALDAQVADLQAAIDAITVGAAPDTMVSEAIGDGTANDTSAIQSALDSAEGKTIYLPEGDYKVTAGGITLPDNVHLRGAGVGLTRIVSASASASAAVIDASSATGSKVSDLTIVGSAQNNLRTGILAADDIVIERVRIEDVRHSTAPDDVHCGIKASPAGNVRVRDCDIVDCNIGIFLSDSTDEAMVVNNVIESPNDRMVDGIYCHSGTEANRGLLIQGNTVKNAQQDTSHNGVDGHGIKLYNHRNVRVIGNNVSDCCTSGILVGVGSAGAQVHGNVCKDNMNADEERGTGIYFETEGAAATIQTDVHYGSTCEGNTCFGSYQGIAISYAPAMVCANNICHSNLHDGIQNDSERVVLTGNVCFNNNQEPAYSPPQGYGAGIRSYGVACILIGNVCYDNQSSKTQQYGISLGDNDTSVVFGNSLTGNLTGGLSIWQNGSNNSVQFNLGDKPTVTGSRGSNAALASLLTALQNRRIIVDSSS